MPDHDDEQPQGALVEQATGILTLLYRIDAEQAVDVLRDWARDTDGSVTSVARSLVHAVCAADDTEEWNQEVRAHVETAVGRRHGVRLPRPSGPPIRHPARFRTVR